jgi:hypothetical protein
MEGDEAWGSSAIIVGANAPPELGMASHVMAWSAPAAGQRVPYGLQRGFQRALLLQIRARVSNGDWETTFREWYLRFRASPQQVAA